MAPKVLQSNKVLPVVTLTRCVLAEYTGGMYTHFDDVNDWLTVGADLDVAYDVTGQDYAEAVAQFFDAGVTHVLDLRIEYDDADVWEWAGLPAENYCYAPVVDMWSHIPDEDWFCTIENFVRGFLTERSGGDRLYVHCHMGVNRGPSGAMLALLTADPSLDPWDAFMTIRRARPMSGVVYAEPIGMRHLLNVEGINTIEPTGLPEVATRFAEAIQTYWSPSQRARARSLRGWQDLVDTAV